MGYGMKCNTTPKTGVMQGDANTLQKGAAPPPPPTGAVGGGDASHLSVEVVMQTTEKNQAGDLRKIQEKGQAMTPEKTKGQDTMTMTMTHNPEVARQLFDRLAETAEKLRRDRVLTDHEIATAFMGVGVTLAKHQHGPALAAEWLRDIADHTERDEPALHGPLN